MSADRIQQRAAVEPISRSLAVIPERIVERLQHVRFVVGCDPVFTGLHSYVRSPVGLYRETAHFCAEYHLDDGGPPTVVLPREVRPFVVTHELGHALDCALDWSLPRPEPVSEYAQTNRREAVAEAFAAWLHPEMFPWAAPILHGSAIQAAFEELAA